MMPDRLAKWRPAEDLPAITGAAAAFLSVAGAKVILHSPMWCSAITEMRLEACGISCEGLFSTFVEESDLFFGGEEALREALLEARVAKGGGKLRLGAHRRRCARHRFCRRGGRSRGGGGSGGIYRGL